MTRLLPWAGWMGGIAGWAISDQLGSYLVQLDCTRAHIAMMLLIGVGGAALALIGGLASLRVWRMPGPLDQPYAGARRFIAGTGLLAAAIFLLAILFQTISSVIIPPCHA
ncbi:hypothetical protein LZK98_17560 [Sphingomonas cannabina]|uniref:hypothetical protein n=1 Tax=Sphingomonas cannabina TaxID=2899123 RepID=UPI001F244D24|nr:hypothetical protein [Sphingomonas cannabina]UIJ44839.1 hypothetical protein LZK98_17560 [Sphingomonas cannabina]